jgi:hypothetical protein
MAIRKTKYHFKRTHDTFGWDYVTLTTELDALGCKNTSRRQNTRSHKAFYADDIVYVSIHSLHKISKYNGKDGHKIYKLGSNAWKILKQKTKHASNILHSI